MYADFNYYKTEYFGTTIPSETSYNYYGRLSSAYIEQATFGRATSAKVKVKECECRIAEILYANNESFNEESREVKSESVGGWSKTFVENHKNDDALASKISEAIHLYLGSTGLLYCGIRRR